MADTQNPNSPHRQDAVSVQGDVRESEAEDLRSARCAGQTNAPRGGNGAVRPLPSFYDLMQMGVGELKHLRRHVAANARHRAGVSAALVVRAISIVLFAVCYVTGITLIFGSQASSVAVASFVMLLCLRFVGYTYTFSDNLRALAIVFAVLFAAPLLGAHAGPFARLIVNVVALLALFIVAVNDPRMGNGGTYGFAYCFVAGSLYDVPLDEGEVFARAAAVVAAFACCAFVLWRRRSVTSGDGRLIDAVRSFSPRTSETSRYQLRAALGISLAMFAAHALGFTRVMWAGFVASSLLTPHGLTARDRVGARVGATFAGCLVFFLLYPLMPPAVVPLFGIFVGIGTGLSATYPWSQFFNTLGGLGAAYVLFGMMPSIGWRLAETLLAAAVALAFAAGCSWIGRRPTGSEQ